MQHEVVPAKSPATTRLAKGNIAHRQFFVNEDGPSAAYSVHPVYGPVTKIAMHIDDGGLNYDNIGLADIITLPDGTYRSYGTTRTKDQTKKGIGVWQSEDAVHWHPLMLGQIEREGHKTNLVYIEGLPGEQKAVSHPQVFLLKDGTWRMYFWKHRDGHFRFSVAASDDGLHWRIPDFEKPALFHPSDGGLLKAAQGLGVDPVIEQALSQEQIMRRKRLWTNDALNVYYNDMLDRWEVYGVWLHPAIPNRRVEVDNAPGLHRLIYRRYSDDGLDWSDPELVLWPDGRDPWDLQFYFLSVHWHEDLMIGALGHYRVEDQQQSMDTALCFSREGYRWSRPLRGGWIPRSEPGPGVMDSCGIYAWGRWIDRGDRWQVVYHGTPSMHNSREYTSRSLGATFPKNRLLGIQAGKVTGGFMTEPFFCSETEIKVDANIRGWMRAELCDVFGRKVPGFHLMDSIPITGDSESHVLRWKEGKVADHQYAMLRVRFEFTEGEIYNIAF